MEPRRNRRLAAQAVAVTARRSPTAPPTARRSLRIRPRGYATLGVLAGILLVVLLLAHPHGAPRAAAPPRPGAAAATGGKGSSAGPATTTAAWATLPVAGLSAAADPDGSLWVVGRAPDGGAQLVHLTVGGTPGGWPVTPTPLGSTLRIQTVGTAHVWLAAGTQEISFDKAARTFRRRSSVPAAAAVTIGAYSVGLYAGGAGAPYVLVARTGGLTARRVALPGAPAGARGTALLVGPAGAALAVAAGRVWAITPGSATAKAWGTLPAGADAAGATWGGGRLWVLLPGGAGKGPTLDGLAPGGRPVPLPAAAALPPAAGTALAFAGGRLWWSGPSAAYTYNPTTGATARLPYPVAGPALLVPTTGGRVWLVVGDRAALAG